MAEDSVATAVEQDTHVSGKHRLVNNRYVLEKQLGAGGMGTVFKALQVGVGNTVAIKFLNQALSSDPGLVKRFEQEAKASLAVMHPGAAQLLDTGRDEKTGELYIVFEYVEGEDLRARLANEGALPFDEARDIAMRVGEVLAVAHAKGIVHRDIKPENIRLRRDLGGTHVKVLDFGIARFRKETDARLTAEGSIAGTPGYMAPEQVRAEAVDARTDLYALGLVTFEMMAGRPAYTSTAAATLLVDQLTRPLPTLQEVSPGRAFPEADVGLQKACAKDPAQRFASAKDFVLALKGLPTPPWSSRARAAVAAVNRATPLALTPMPAPTLAPTAPSKWPALVGLLGLLGLLGGGLGFGAWKLSQSTTVKALTPVVAACPGSDLYKDELRRLSTAELEQKVRAMRLMPPSMMARQLESMQGTVSNAPRDNRECMYRLMLMSTLSSEETALRTTPELWGHTREVNELELLLLEMPLKERWTVAQRKDVIRQIDELYVANLKKDGPEDETHWRRQYLGLELTCEATDEVLTQLGARRPSSCLNLTPRN
ncbi:MAG: serine/threonine protein kinase [Myxococcaceae bacterium]|jgi:serine/threonine protein kinase|nr:serine/threonine protein kinase [Myxococcaceae bacterium]